MYNSTTSNDGDQQHNTLVRTVNQVSHGQRTTHLCAARVTRQGEPSGMGMSAQRSHNSLGQRIIAAGAPSEAKSGMGIHGCANLVKPPT